MKTLHQFSTHFILSALCITVPLASAEAQQSPTGSTLSASAVLQRSYISLVGATSLTDVTLSGSATRIAGSDNETGTATYEALGSGASRLDGSYPSGVRSEIRANITTAPMGAWSGPDGIQHPIAFHNLRNSAGLFPAFSLALLLYSSQTVNAQIIGEEIKAGQPVYHVAISQAVPQLSAQTAALSQHLTQIDMYINTSSFLPVAFNFNTHPEDDAGQDVPVELLFSEYRLVNGVQIPFRVQKYLNNGLVLDLTFESAAINTGLSSASFQVTVSQ
jgi:hypothetical protein